MDELKTKIDPEDVIPQLKEWAKMDNLATEADIDQKELDKIGARAKIGYEADKQSMTEWLEDVRKAEELAELKSTKKNRPLPNSANIKYPLISKAAYEFSSRTYPEIVKDGKVVKGHVIGLDFTSDKRERCDRVADYMNYQLLFESDDWEKGLDTLLNQLAIIGFICKKTYYDPIRKMVKSDICDYKDLIIHSDVKSLSDARRISHILHFRLNDLMEYVNDGLFCEEPVYKIVNELKEDELDPHIKVVEQHTFLDLDGDNYAEPYIVSFLEKTGELLRIVPRFDADCIVSNGKKLKRIDPHQQFTDYHFLVNPKGKFQSVGFGILMLHLNTTINTILNQLIDAGQLANLRGGYKDSRLKNMGSGDSLHDPGEWRDVKAMAGVTLKEGMLPIDYKEPSNVLLQLLGLLIQAGKELSSSTEVMTGAASTDNAKTGAVAALQKEGMKLHTSILRRVYRSLSSEFQKIYRLDSEYLDEKKYFHIIDQPKVVMKDDFNERLVKIMPIADPNLSSDIQRDGKNQILVAAQSLPGTNKIRLTQAILDNNELGIPTKDLMLPPEALNQPNPEVLKVQAEIQSWADQSKLKAEELHIRQFEAKVEFFKTEAQIMLLKAQALNNIAQAQAQQDNGKFQEYQMQLDILSKHMDAMKDAAEFMQTERHHQDDMQMQQQASDQNQQSLDQNQQQLDQQAQQNDQAASASDVAG